MKKVAKYASDFNQLFNTGVDFIAGKTGIANSETGQLVTDLAKSIGNDLIDNATGKSQSELKASQDSAVRQADTILSQYRNLDCDSMSDDQKREIAFTLGQFMPLFQQLGMSDRLIEVVRKYNIPTNCPVPAKKKVVTPVLIGVGTSGVSYFALKPVLKSKVVTIFASAVAGGGVGYASYRLMNKQKEVA